MSAEAGLPRFAAPGRAAMIAALAAAIAGCQGAPASEAAAGPEAAEPFRAADWLSQCDGHDDWDRPGPPFRIFANTWYVGTCGIAAILVTGPDGHVLIDGGTEAGGPLIAANIERAGFDLDDVNILLLSHEHFDHAGGLAALQQATGAQLLASPEAAWVIERGTAHPDDPQASVLDPFAPVEVSGTIADGEVVRLGPLAITAIATPGHTAGAMSYAWRACEEPDADRSEGRMGVSAGAGACREIVYLDSLSAVSADDYRFSAHPELVARFRASYDKVARLACDIALTPHPTSSAMPERLGSPEGLTDPQGCARYAETMRARLDARLADESVASTPAAGQGDGR